MMIGRYLPGGGRPVVVRPRLLSPDQVGERQEIYDKLAPSSGDEFEQAYEVFQIIARETTGPAASVADQRLAQLEILKDAELYAGLGGLTVSEIVDRLAGVRTV